MTSELAQRFCVKVSLPAENYALVFDEQLQEVREVLAITSKHRDADDLPCWCQVMMQTLPHMEDCQRARTLYEKLKVED